MSLVEKVKQIPLDILVPLLLLKLQLFSYVRSDEVFLHKVVGTSGQGQHEKWVGLATLCQD